MSSPFNSHKVTKLSTTHAELLLCSASNTPEMRSGCTQMVQLLPPIFEIAFPADAVGRKRNLA